MGKSLLISHGFIFEGDIADDVKILQDHPYTRYRVIGRCMEFVLDHLQSRNKAQELMNLSV